MGRTQLQDAVPMRLGQSFHAYASVIQRDIHRLENAQKEMYRLNMGELPLELQSTSATPIYSISARKLQN